jgi:hypothetical protein
MCHFNSKRFNYKNKRLEKTERFIKNGQIQRHGQHWGTKVTTLGREDTGRRLTKQTKKHNTEYIKDEQHQNSGMNPGAVPVFYKTPP